MRVPRWIAVVVLLAGCVKPARMLNQDGSYQRHDEPYPSAETDTWVCMAGRMDVVDASVSFAQEGETPLKVVRVEGYTEMPDDADVVVALRPVGNRLYKTWADVVARDHRFAADLGPFTYAQLPPGTYVVEVMWLTHRQEPHVRAAADVQDANMRHRDRDMDVDHRSSKILYVPASAPIVAAEPAEEPAGSPREVPAGEPSGEPTTQPGEPPVEGGGDGHR